MNGYVLKGALNPTLNRPLYTPQFCAYGTLKEMLYSQQETHPTLNIPFVLDHFIKIVENFGLKNPKIFKSTHDPSALRSVLWEIEHNYKPDWPSPVQASDLVKVWLSEIKEPIIPGTDYNNVLDLLNSYNIFPTDYRNVPKEDLRKLSTEMVTILSERNWNRAVFYELVAFFRRVSDFEVENGCSLSFLAGEFAPIFFRKNSLEKKRQIILMEIVFQHLIIPERYQRSSKERVRYTKNE